ncbi:hypothetical protein I3J14_13955 [Streptomyces sp. HB-N217]|uniref:hypothetical protein n=1 Tax=Streptomyces sp. HB-N217 TaxID=2792016 RepID=UPI0018D5EA14|nr:hypothetical protein [Streptomyces sp. HB-N217]MBH5131247.1 hypothetical protein [Streptomyces sp. HB-N217]
MTDNAPQPPMPSVPPLPESQPKQPAQPEQSSAAVASAEKRLSNRIVVGAAVSIVAAVIGTGIVVVQALDNDDSRPAATASSAPPTETATPLAEETVPEPVYADLTPDSFSMTLRTTRQQCFGSAGCNVTVEPSLSYLGDSASLDPAATYDITYEITGDESGPVIGTAELSDRTTLNYTPSLIRTASSGTKVSVKITDIRTQGV